MQNERRTRERTLPHIDPVNPNAHHFPFVDGVNTELETQAGSSTCIQHPVDGTSQSANANRSKSVALCANNQPLYLVTLYAPTGQNIQASIRRCRAMTAVMRYSAYVAVECTMAPGPGGWGHGDRTWVPG